MSYLVLARKYRPRTFDEVVGQEAAATALLKAMEQDRLGHAFLFSGSRGTGKTSMARILARSLNCEKGPTDQPCGKCEICTGIDAGQDVDVQEIDAATYSKVENIRELRESIPYSTLRARFKILIIDEIHRLSAAAFDALLKILEEPPAHVKFIFATTEPQKVPETIRSRCQHFEFRRIAEDRIVSRLVEICKLEKVEPQGDLLALIARSSQGGLRDSLSLLDQVISFAGKKPTPEDLEKMAGRPGGEAVLGLLEKVFQEDRQGILEQVDSLWEQGSGEENLLVDLAERLRSLLVMKICGKETKLIKASEEERSRLETLAADLSVEALQRMLMVSLGAREKARLLAGQGRALVELALLRMAGQRHVLPAASLLQRLEALEKGGGSTRPYTVPAAPPKEPAKPAGQGPLWPRFLTSLRADRKSLADLMERKGRFLGTETGRFEIQLAGVTAMERSILEDERNRKAVEQLLQKLSAQDLPLVLREAAAGEVTAPKKQGKGDPLLDQAMDLFEGKIVE